MLQLGAVLRVCASKEWAIERGWSRAILSKARGDHIESQHEQKCLNLAQRERERERYLYLYIHTHKVLKTSVTLSATTL